MSLGNPPRTHHYRFVHQTFAQAAFQFAPRLIAVARVGDVTPPVMAMWDSVGELLEPAERIPSDGLGVTLHAVAGHDVLLVEPPPARHATEGHYAAVCAHAGPQALRYLVLEYSQPAETVLGEWTEDRTHLNLGPGAPPEPGAFLTDLEQRLGQRPR